MVLYIGVKIIGGQWHELRCIIRLLYALESWHVRILRRSLWGQRGAQTGVTKPQELSNTGAAQLLLSDESGVLLQGEYLVRGVTQDPGGEEGLKLPWG